MNNKKRNHEGFFSVWKYLKKPFLLTITFMHQRGVNGFRGVKKYVFERGYIVGEMNCFADTSLKRIEF